MKNRVTNLALLRGGSPEPRALCGPVFALFLSLVCWRGLASLDTSSPGEPSTWPPMHQDPVPRFLSTSHPKSQSLTAMLSSFRIQVTREAIQKGFLTFTGLSRRAGQLFLVPLKSLTGLYHPGHAVQMPHPCWTASAEGRA